MGPMWHYELGFVYISCDDTPMDCPFRTDDGTCRTTLFPIDLFHHMLANPRNLRIEKVETALAIASYRCYRIELLHEL